MNKSYAGFGLILLVILIGAWAIISNKQTPATTGFVKVGVIAPLTGPLAEYGEAFKNGITLAQEHSPNKNVEYVFEDSAYDAGKTVSAYYKLRDTDKVDILMNWGDPTSQALAPLMKDSSIPFVAVTTQTGVTSYSPYTIHSLDTADDFAKVLWTYFRAHGKKNIALVKVENSYLNNLYAAIDKNKTGDEKVTLIDTYQSFGDHDFRTSIIKIKNAGSYDEVGVFLGNGQIGQFYAQATALGLKVSTFGSDFFENQADIDDAGKAIEGAVYVNYDVSAEFKNLYQEQFGNINQISYAANGYDTVMLLNKINSANKDTVLAGLKAVKNYEGVSGSYHYVENGSDRYLFSPAYVKVIENGEIKTLK